MKCISIATAIMFVTLGTVQAAPIPDGVVVADVYSETGAPVKTIDNQANVYTTIMAPVKTIDNQANVYTTITAPIKTLVDDHCDGDIIRVKDIDTEVDVPITTNITNTDVGEGL
ncbi:hypothetical protein BGZ82_004209, partial [Podila clonocystis]